MLGGGQTAPDRAAFYNGALVRYLDFNDSYPTKGETCHPSDNLGAVLAAAEYAGAHRPRLSRRAGRGLPGAVPAERRSAGAAQGIRSHDPRGLRGRRGRLPALGLPQLPTAHAIAIAGTAFNALRVTRTGKLSHWKGLAYPGTPPSAAPMRPFWPCAE